jgi:hypothetical protein
MRMTVILVSICSLFLISCATLNTLIGGGSAPAGQASTDSAAASPGLEASNVAPAASADQTYASQEMADSGQASTEVQAAEHQTAQADAMNEQRSASELDAAAPETTASGTDNFYASSQPSTPEVEQVTSTPPSELPQKQVASWDQHTSAPSYEEEQPMPVKKSKKVVKNSKHDKKKIAKHSKKSKKEIAKRGKKADRMVASKKAKVDCKKVAKNTKKSSKREIAMCKAEIKKEAKYKKSHKTGKVAQAGCQCNYR